jgi:anti-anti-sigma regulatory factor/HAMP domain-containing protein
MAMQSFDDPDQGFETPTMAPAPVPPAQGEATRSKVRPRLGRLGRGIILRFVAFAVILFLVMMAVLAYAALRQLESVRALQSQMAIWTANSLDGWVQELDKNLATSALNDRLLDLEPEDLQIELEALLMRSPALRYATLVDTRTSERRREVMTVNADGTVSTGANLASNEWFLGALEQGHYITRPQWVKGVPMFFVAHSVIRDGKAIGVLAAQADLTWAYTILANARTDRGGYSYVVDNVGRPILHESGPFIMAHQARADIVGINAAITQQGMPFWGYRGLNEEEAWVLGEYQGTASRWFVVAEQPIVPILGDFLPLALGAAGVILISTLAALVIAVYMARRVGTPIAQLGEGARRIGTGDLSHRLEIPGRNELTALAEEFNRMAAGLRESQARQEAWSHELEMRVRERTAEVHIAMDQLQEESRAKENLLVLVREMSSPVIPVMEGIIVIPIVGALDSERAQRVMDALLAGVERESARVAILDITGLAVVDTAVANALLQASQAAQLLGAQPILVGISPEVAETLVQLGVEIRHIRTAATLQEGLQMALSALRRRVVAVGRGR